MNDSMWMAWNERVLTCSRVRTWWLTRVHGYQVVTRRLAPKMNLYGSLEMAPYWILSAPATLQDRS